MEVMLVATEQLSEGEIGERLAKATAKLSAKFKSAFVAAGFNDAEALMLTAAYISKK